MPTTNGGQAATGSQETSWRVTESEGPPPRPRLPFRLRRLDDGQWQVETWHKPPITYRNTTSPHLGMALGVHYLAWWNSRP